MNAPGFRGRSCLPAVFLFFPHSIVFFPHSSGFWAIGKSEKNHKNLDFDSGLDDNIFEFHFCILYAEVEGRHPFPGGFIFFRDRIFDPMRRCSFPNWFRNAAVRFWHLPFWPGIFPDLYRQSLFPEMEEREALFVSWERQNRRVS